MAPAATARVWSTPAARVHARSTGVGEGDFAVDGDTEALAARRATLRAGAWTWLRQVHGADVVTVEHAGQHAGARADAAVTTRPGCTLAVTTADCAPVVLVASAGVAVVHAGWRGLEAGVVEAAARALVEAAAGDPVAAWLGPCIGPAAYEFGPEPLHRLQARFGPSVAASTAQGRTALDVRAAVRAACTAAGYPPPADPACTSDPRWWSHRVRGDTARQTTVAWIDARASLP